MSRDKQKLREAQNDLVRISHLAINVVTNLRSNAATDEEIEEALKKFRRILHFNSEADLRHKGDITRLSGQKFSDDEKHWARWSNE